MITRDYLSLSSLGPYLKKLHYRAIYCDIDLYAGSADLTVAHNISLQVISSCVRQRNHLICDAERYDQWDLNSVIRAPSRPLLPKLSSSFHTIHIPFPASYLISVFIAVHFSTKRQPCLSQQNMLLTLFYREKDLI